MELVIDLHPAKLGPTFYLKISETLHSDEIALKTKGRHEENSSRLDLRAKRQICSNRLCSKNGLLFLKTEINLRNSGNFL